MTDLPALVTTCLVELLPELDGREIRASDRLEVDLGLNSIDRADLVQQCMESLGVDLPMTRFAEVRTVGELLAELGRAP